MGQCGCGAEHWRLRLPQSDRTAISQQAGEHQGGYTPIHLSIGDYLKPGTNHIVVRATDSDSWQQPRGKQEGTTRWPIDYDAVIGIWQSVWLEPTNAVHITHLGSHYDLRAQQLHLTCTLSDQFHGQLTAQFLARTNDLDAAATSAEGQARSELRITLMSRIRDCGHPSSLFFMTLLYL